VNFTAFREQVHEHLADPVGITPQIAREILVLLDLEAKSLLRAPPGSSSLERSLMRSATAKLVTDSSSLPASIFE